MATRRQDTGWSTAAALDRLIGQFIIDMREELGLRVMNQHDPGGRIISYGFHWHEPNEQEGCKNRIFYGYPTPLAALCAGLKAKLGADQPSNEDGELEGRVVTACRVKR
jgi:hypothetical protein